MHPNRRDLVLGAGLAAVGFVTHDDPASADDGVRWELSAKPGALHLGADARATDILGFGDPAALAVFRAKPGEAVTLKSTNGLKAPLSFRVEGVRTLGAVGDGSTVEGLAPGASAERILRFPDSGTYWIRAVAGAGDETAKGVSAVAIIEDATPPAVDQDVVLLLGDWPPGGTETKATSPAGAMLVNRRPGPAAFTVQPGARMRLRLVNGSIRRMAVVVVEGAKPLIVAIDGQPSELFAPIRDMLPIGPGGRFDIMLDLPRDAGQTVRLALRSPGSQGGGDSLATIATAGAPVDARPPIAALARNPALPLEIPLEASKRAELTIARQTTNGAPESWTVNGVSGIDLPAAPVLRVKRGDSVTLGFTNTSDALVALHVRGQAMRLLHAKDDGWEPYWRDSVILPPGARSHVAFVADTRGKWPIESAIDLQLLSGLRCWFEVT